MSFAPSTTLGYQFAHAGEHRQTQIQVLTGIFTGLSTLATCLRLISRRLVQVRWGYDDAIIIWSQIVAYGYCGVTIAATRHAFGEHLVVVSLPEIYTTKEIQYFIEVLYIIGIFSVKYAILIFYHSIFPTRRFRQAIWLLGALLSGHFIANVIVIIFPCRPISYYWNNTQEGSCIDNYAFTLSTGIIIVVLDVCILSLPLPLLWRLHVSMKQKLALTSVFLVGIFACLVSIFRLRTLYLLYTDDPSWDSYWPSLWSTIELNICIVCACLPLMLPLARKFGDVKLGRCISSVRTYIPGLRTSKGGLSTQSSRATNPSRGGPLSIGSSPTSPRKKKKGWFTSLGETTWNATTVQGTMAGAEGDAALEAGLQDERIHDAGLVGLARVEPSKAYSGTASIPLQDLGGLAAEPNDVTAHDRWSTWPRQTHVAMMAEDEIEESRARPDAG